MNPNVDVAVRLMKDNLNRRLTLDEIAEISRLRHSRLNDLFNAQLGMSPVQYHKYLRLEKVCELLAETTWTVDRIRLEVGYDHSHFFRDFKAQFKQTPSEYRLLHSARI